MGNLLENNLTYDLSDDTNQLYLLGGGLLYAEYQRGNETGSEYGGAAEIRLVRRNGVGLFPYYFCCNTDSY